MAKNEIVVNEKHFINNACGKSVKAWFKAADGMNKNTWLAAKAVYDMTAFETWKDDFSTQKELAEFLGSSQSQISKMSRAYEYSTRAYDEDEDGNVTLIFDGYTLAAVTAIMKVPLSLLRDFMSLYNITRETPSRTISEYVNEYLTDEDGNGGEESEVIENVTAESVSEIDEDGSGEVFAALVIIEKKINTIAENGEMYDVDIERVERALNDLKTLLI